MKKTFKKITAIATALTMVVGTVSFATAAVKTGTDIAAGTTWASFSIHTREDKGEW